MTRTLQIVAIITCLMLAGCSGAATEEAGSKLAGKTESRIIGPSDDVAGASSSGDGGVANAAQGNGEIRGRVVDDALFPVPGAGVSLLSTEFSTTTDRNGTFAFANVTPGAAGLRVTAAIYRVHEGTVDVKADRITEVTITLVPADDRGPGYRPHLHDYWGSNVELGLMDDDVDWPTEPSCTADYSQYGPAETVFTGVYGPNQANYWVCFSVPERSDSRPPIVLPGTAKVRFKISWDEADVDVDRFIFGYTTASKAAFTDLDPVTNGAEVTITLEEGAADNGHQMFSLWKFHLRPAPRTAPMTILGPIHVVATLVKGILPVDKPHEDFWNGSSQYLARSYATAHVVGTICCTDTHIVLEPDAKALIPPGTKTLHLRLGWKSTSASGTPHDMDWSIAYKPANLPPVTPWSAYTELKANSTGTLTKSYVVAVEPFQTDAFYQKRSNWDFWVHLPSAQHTPIGITEYGHTFYLEIIALKDPSFV